MAAVTFTRFAGINNVLPAERIRTLPTQDNPTCELTDAVNVDIDNSGQLSRRAGQTLRVPGAAHSLWADGEICLYIAGTSLYRLNADMTSAMLATGLTAGAAASYVRVNERVYWTNGEQTGIVANGMARSWGMPIVETQPNAAPISGSLTAGKYQVAMTWLRDDGQESGTATPLNIELAEDAGIRFTWEAPSDPAIEDVALYVSEPNGMILYRAMTAPASGGTADYTEGARALPLDTLWQDAPPPGQALAYSRGRLYIAQGQFLFATNALGYEYVDMRDYLAPDGGTIRFLAGVEHGLYIGTDHGVYFAAGDRLEEMERRVVATAPAIANSVVTADAMLVTGNRDAAGKQAVLFATEDGICIGTEEGAVSNLTRERYRLGALPASAAVFRASPIAQYLLLPGIALNPHLSAVTTYSGITANSAANFGGETLLATAAGIISLDGDTDLGAPIAASVSSGISDLGGEPVKRVVSGIAGYRAAGDVELTLVADGHHESTYVLQPRRLDDPHAARVKFGRGAKGRYWQWRFANRDGAAFAVDSLTLDAQALSRKLA